ncbi:MAG: sec-independent protein translocase protein TatC, partial [Frankiales bacterium]|jgi:sec-independent protein translocase protein TatC|nr:sec-independent protein translocase protein TatC [Frankiales bacterium]MDX6211846.1 sec-independent protein translocase protein TatC [Frankiales bacterium]
MATTKPRRKAVPAAGPDGRMSLIDHFIELRTRVIRATVAIMIGMVVGFIIWHPVLNILKEPYCSLPIDKRHPYGGITQCELNYSHPLDGFSIKLKVSAIVGVLIAAPVWLYQLWAFITPGLKRNERRWALSFVGASVLLFSAGVVAAYLMLSKALEFLLGAAGSGTTSILDIAQYIGFVTRVMLLFGLSFEFPLVIVILNLAHLVRHERLWSFRRMEIFLVTVFAAVVTPSTDPYTMLALAAPLWVLYEVAALIAWAHDKRVDAKTAALTELSPDEPSPMPLPSSLADAEALASTSTPEDPATR